MFLKQLKILDSGETLRSILFKKGVNLVIDETSTSDKKVSGNNVGKTTVIRLVDYCLGGDGTNIYKDTEFKYKTNTEIENYLVNKNIVISLVLKEDLDIESSEEIIIRRNFLKRKQKIQEINGESYSDHDFPKKLKELIFHSTASKPTFRQIIAKNIRDEKNRLNNTLKVLSPFTSLEEYESVYLFWLGVESDQNERKQTLLREKSAEESVLKNLKKEHSLSQIKQSLIVLARSIKELENKKKNIKSNQSWKKQLGKLNDVKFEINKISTDLGRLEFRKNLILESKNDLESEFSNIDKKQIEDLYKEAKALIPSIQKSFSETLDFHNQMVQEKVKYITQELPNLEEQIVKIKDELSRLLIEESSLTTQLHKDGALEGLESIYAELNVAYEKKGRFEELNSIWVKSVKKLDSIEEELVEINKGITSKDSLLQKRITDFNKFFSDMSYKLYGERFVLSADIGEKGYELNISSISGNLGTGKKKGQIAAFDLAYIQFADSADIPCLHFILHDQVENVHDNQINMLVEIIERLNCQYVLPILRDKLPTDLDVSKLEVLSLSENDKLFKVK